MFAIRITTMLLLLRCSVAFIPTVLKGLGTSRSESVVAHAMQNEWKKKGPMESAGGPGNVMAAATVPVQFKVIGSPEEDRDIMAIPGAPLSDVAIQADVFIKYKCRKGECGTCEVMQDGKWIKACQTKVASLGKDVPYVISVRSVPKDKRSQSSSASFFSPKSLMDGFANNVYGMVGMVVEGASSDEDFQARMDKEKELQAKLEAKKAAKAKEGK